MWRKQLVNLVALNVREAYAIFVAYEGKMAVVEREGFLVFN